MELGKDAAMHGFLEERASGNVAPYPQEVAYIMGNTSTLRNYLGHNRIADEGLFVPLAMGVEGKVIDKILAGEKYYFSYACSPAEILRI